MKTHRLHALDSLRGIAAFIVMLQHCSLMFPESFREQLPVWISANPLRIFLNGYASVLLFFVLSGYVLAIPYTQNKNQPYLPFLIKRICRIYIPFVFAIFAAALLYYYSTPIFGLGSIAFRSWWPVATPLTPDIIVQHIAMTGILNHMWLDSPMWSLAYEMRISIIFPLLIILCRDLRQAIFLALLFCVAAPLLAIAAGRDWILDTSINLGGTFLITLRFVPFFMLGIILVKYNNPIRAWMKSLSRAKLLFLFTITMIIFYLPVELKGTPWDNFAVPYHYILGIVLGLASGFLIIVARHAPRAEALLNTPIPQWLGNISYSLYLLHVPVMLFTFRMLLGKLPFPLIVAMDFSAALIMASVFYLVIERPAMLFGKHLAAMIEGRTVKKAA